MNLLNLPFTEILGIIATVLLIISMMYNPKNKRSLITMRTINGIAAILFIIYSVLLSAYSTIVSNFIILCVDLYYIIRTFKDKE